VVSTVVNTDHSVLRPAVNIAYPIALLTGIRPGVPQPTEWERSGDEIKAAMITARTDFVNVFNTSHFPGLRGNRFTSTANSTAANTVRKINGDQFIRQLLAENPSH
jgi:hypothetical protein